MIESRRDFLKAASVLFVAGAAVVLDPKTARAQSIVTDIPTGSDGVTVTESGGFLEVEIKPKFRLNTEQMANDLAGGGVINQDGLKVAKNELDSVFGGNNFGADRQVELYLDDEGQVLLDGVKDKNGNTALLGSSQAFATWAGRNCMPFNQMTEGETNEGHAICIGGAVALVAAVGIGLRAHSGSTGDSNKQSATAGRDIGTYVKHEPYVEPRINNEGREAIRSWVKQAGGTPEGDIKWGEVDGKLTPMVNPNAAGPNFEKLWHSRYDPLDKYSDSMIGMHTEAAERFIDLAEQCRVNGQHEKQHEYEVDAARELRMANRTVFGRGLEDQDE